MRDESIFCAMICYLEDSESESSFPDLIRPSFERFGFYPPAYVCDKPHTKYVTKKFAFDPNMFLRESYLLPDNYTVALKCTNSRKFGVNMCEVVIDHVFHGDSGFRTNGSRVWNTIKINCSYDLFEQSEMQNRFLGCTLSLIEAIKPVYVILDDLKYEVEMRTARGEYMAGIMPHRYGEPTCVCWGNYFGAEYCRKYGLDVDTDVSVTKMAIGDGVFFTMSDTPLDYSSEQCLENRRKTARFFNIVPPNEYYR